MKSCIPNWNSLGYNISFCYAHSFFVVFCLFYEYVFKLQKTKYTSSGEEISPTPSESLESALFSRWESFNREAKASAGTTYSRRQLRYLWRVCTELVKCKNLVFYVRYTFLLQPKRTYQSCRI